jgi:hypothetical protein
MTTTTTPGGPWASDRPDSAELLATIRDTALANLPAGDGGTLIRDAAGLYGRAADEYEQEIADVERDWARLEAGAGEHRRRQAAPKFAADEAVASKLARAGHDTIVEALTVAALPAPPAVGSGEERALRDELTMLAGNATGAQLGPLLLEIAQGPRRDLAALTLTPWFDSFARARGGVKADVRAALRTTVALAAEKHGATDIERAAAARLRTARRDAIAATTAARNAARARMSRADRQRRNRQAALARIDNRTIDGPDAA